MELRGQFSNPLTRKRVDVLVKVMDCGWTSGAAAEQALHEASKPRIQHVVDVDELVRCFRRGRKIKELAIDYAISESSVKRLLRERVARRY